MNILSFEKNLLNFNLKCPLRINYFKIFFMLFYKFNVTYFKIAFRADLLLFRIVMILNF